MGRAYAGILGPLAMIVVILRSVIMSGGVEGTLTTATLYLILFSAIGFILGHLAQLTVDESVRSKIRQQLIERADSSTPATP